MKKLLFILMSFITLGLSAQESVYDFTVKGLNNEDVSLKDYSGKVIDTDWTYAVDSTWLDPGESKSFEMMIRDEYGKIQTADVSIINE